MEKVEYQFLSHVGLVDNHTPVTVPQALTSPVLHINESVCLLSYLIFVRCFWRTFAGQKGVVIISGQVQLSQRTKYKNFILPF